MGRAHEVAIGADGRAFNQAIKNDIIKPVDDAARSLDEFADAGEDAGRDGSNGLDDIKDTLKDVDRASDDAERALGDVEDAAEDAGRDGSSELGKLEDALRDAERQSGNTGRSIGRDLDDGFDKAKTGAEDFKDEANSTAREAAASFDGSAESIADAFQEVAANAFAGFGPVGAAAGLAAAAGIGMAVAGFEAVDEANKASQELVNEWVEKYIDGFGTINEAAVMQGIQQYQADTEKMAEAQAVATATGLDLTTVLRGLNGDMTDAATVTDALTDAKDRNDAAMEKVAGTQGAYLQAQTDEYKATVKATEVWDKHNGIIGEARGKWDVYSDAAAIGAIRTAEAAVKAGEATKKVDEFGDTVYSLPEGKTLHVDAETGKATEDLEQFNKIDIDKSAVIDVKVNDRAWRNWKPNPKTGTINARVTGRVAV